MWNGSFKSVTVSFVSWISLLVDARHRPRAAVRSRSGAAARAPGVAVGTRDLTWSNLVGTRVLGPGRGRVAAVRCW